MQIIGIAGHAGSGKDTVADIIILEDTWNHSKYFKAQFPNKADFIHRFLINKSITVNACSNFKKVAFADSLKRALAAITNTDVDFWYDSVFKDAPNMLKINSTDGHTYTNRELLQLFGTEIGRTISPDIWIKSLAQVLEDTGQYIIPDVRFVNEADFIKDKGGILLKVNRVMPTMDHISENSLNNYTFTYTIENNGSVKDLIQTIINLHLND